MSKSWKNLVAQNLGIDVDLAILDANDFLMKQIEVLLKIIEKNKVKLQFTDEDRNITAFEMEGANLLIRESR